MIAISNKKDWFLHNNGISIVSKDNKSIIDLHNDCELQGVLLDKPHITLSFIKIANYSNSSAIKLGSNIRMVIDNVDKADFPVFEYPEVFEGIYDFASECLSLCIGSEACYPVIGKKLELKIET